MTHYGNTGIHNSTDISCLGCPPFQLDSIRSSQKQFLCGLHGLFHRIIRMYGHISHQQGVLHSARSSFHMMKHMIQRHMSGIRKAQNHHPQGIPYQHNIYAGFIQKAACRIVISSNQSHMPPVLAGADSFRFLKRLIHGVQ